MALLDLQGMEMKRSAALKPPPGSRASKGCGNDDAGSNLSLLLCEVSL